MNYIAQCLNKFSELPEAVKASVGSFEVLAELERLEERYGVDLSFLIVLVMIREVTLEDTSAYLMKKFGFSEEDALDIRDELTREIFSNLLLTGAEIMPEAAVKESFAKDLVKLLSDNREADRVNRAVFSLFAKNGAAQDELLKTLLANQEKIGDSRIETGEKAVLSTVENWLKDFIKKYGSGSFDDISLAQYLVDSPDIRKLSPSDKKAVSKLLRVYRNLAFFPESMGNASTADWEIIPTDKETENKPSTNQIPKTVPAKGKPEPVKSREVREQEELEQALKKYSPSSLEYKAIKQEIGRKKIPLSGKI